MMFSLVPALPAAHPAHPRVIIASDNPDLLTALRQALETDYALLTMPNGDGLLEHEPVHLVIVDAQMGGLEMLKAVRLAKPDVPVVLATLQASSADIARGLDAGADDYLCAPFDAGVARARIQRLIRLKQQSDERQQALNELRQAHEMKDYFLRIASHDLKNPLQSIRLAQYYLRSVVNDDPASLDALDTIDDTLDLMHELVENFIDTLALQEGKADVQLSRVEVETVMWEVLARYGASANRKNITLLIGDSDGYALADEARLAQILSNLVSNAVKYSPPNGFVTVSAQTRGDRVRLSVTDEGPGIAAEERPQLFQAFGKLSSRPTGGESSSGLGLWIVKELAQMQNGAVGADFPAEGGSVFWVELPGAPSTSG